MSRADAHAQDAQNAQNKKRHPPLTEAAVRQLDKLPEWKSVCGFRRDPLATGESPHVSLHYMRIQDSEPHYHKKTTEFYFVAEGEGDVELDGTVHRVRKGDMIAIPPHTWHTSRPAEGSAFHVLIIACPPETTGHSDCYFE